MRDAERIKREGEPAEQAAKHQKPMTRRTENADAETDNGRRAECRRNDAAAIEPNRKPPDLPLQNDTAENEAAHADSGAGETHATHTHTHTHTPLQSAPHPPPNDTTPTTQSH